MTELNSKHNKKYNLNHLLRVIFAIFYYLLSILLVTHFKTKIFYFQVLKDSWNFYRFIWCFASSSFGFANIALISRKNDNSPLPQYLTYYPLQLLASSALIFSFLHFSEKTSGFLFYYLSFPLCFILGYLVDRIWEILLSITKNIKSVFGK